MAQLLLSESAILKKCSCRKTIYLQRVSLGKKTQRAQHDQYLCQIFKTQLQEMKLFFEQ